MAIRDAKLKPNQQLDALSSEAEDRTAYRRVPQEILERASVNSEAPHGLPEDSDDRTAIFAPPSELLTELREQMALRDAEQRVTPVAPIPRFSESPKSQAPGSQPPPSQAPASQAPASQFPKSLLAPGSLLGTRSMVPGSRPMRAGFVVALLVLLLAASCYAYLRSGGSLPFRNLVTKAR